MIGMPNPAIESAAVQPEDSLYPLQAGVPDAWDSTIAKRLTRADRFRRELNSIIYLARSSECGEVLIPLEGKVLIPLEGKYCQTISLPGST